MVMVVGSTLAQSARDDWGFLFFEDLNDGRFFCRERLTNPWVNYYVARLCFLARWQLLFTIMVIRRLIATLQLLSDGVHCGEGGFLLNRR